MKVLGLFFATTLSVLSAGVVVQKAGWLSCPHESVSRRCVELGRTCPTEDSAYREAAARWRRCQPHHWRYCMLNR
jgi:hypothetical protein